MGSVWIKSIASSVCVRLVSAHHLPLFSLKAQNGLTTGKGGGRERVWAGHEEVIKGSPSGWECVCTEMGNLVSECVFQILYGQKSKSVLNGP